MTTNSPQGTAPPIKSVIITHSEIMELFRRVIIVKCPELSNEEFEVEVVLNPYNSEITVSTEYR